MTLILTIATVAVLTFLGLSCRRARLDLEEQLCECSPAPVAAAVGFGPNRMELAPAHPVLIGIDGGRRAVGASVGGRRRQPHLRVVEGR
jgi:hypothetical protein